MRKLHAGAIGEELDREVVERAGAGRAVGDGSRGLLADLDQLGQRAGGEARMHDDHVGRGRDQADRIEVLARVVAEVLQQARRGPDRRAGGHQDGVAVGRALGDRARRDRAAGAAAIVDDDLLAERLAHLVGDAARRGAGAAAGRERNDERDRARRIGPAQPQVRRPQSQRGKQDEARRAKWSIKRIVGLLQPCCFRFMPQALSPPALAPRHAAHPRILVHLCNREADGLGVKRPA